MGLHEPSLLARFLLMPSRPFLKLFAAGEAVQVPGTKRVTGRSSWIYLKGGRLVFSVPFHSKNSAGHDPVNFITHLVWKALEPLVSTSTVISMLS